MSATQALFPAIEAGDLGTLGALLDADPMLVHAQHADPAVLRRAGAREAARVLTSR
jgi:hypothetical protein